MSRFHLSVVCLPLVLGCAPQLDNSVPVRPGIEVLLSDSLHLVADRSVGILTNSTGIDRSGVGDIERLLAFGIDLRAVFAPEHGFFAQLDQENIGDDVDSTTGLPIYSLYGDVREPTPEMLANLDVLLIDLQDIGARPYTYISTAL
ncbi:MAG: exo-beta-N-acetylmuramidase NamZ domain-containing protein, partial [Gemmatimonadales bacterium]